MRFHKETLSKIAERIAASLKIRKILYTALILDNASHTTVQEWFKQVSGESLLNNILAHHITIQFKPTEDQVSAVGIGTEASVNVVGWVSDEKAQVVVVSGLTVSSGTPHITVATASGVLPEYSKQLLQGKINMVEGPELTGKIEAVRML